MCTHFDCDGVVMFEPEFSVSRLVSVINKMHCPHTFVNNTITVNILGMAATQAEKINDSIKRQCGCLSKANKPSSCFLLKACSTGGNNGVASIAKERKQPPQTKSNLSTVVVWRGQSLNISAVWKWTKGNTQARRQPIKQATERAESGLRISFSENRCAVTDHNQREREGRKKKRASSANLKL